MHPTKIKHAYTAGNLVLITRKGTLLTIQVNYERKMDKISLKSQSKAAKM
jgi:hypothetical protein